MLRLCSRRLIVTVSSWRTRCLTWVLTWLETCSWRVTETLWVTQLERCSQSLVLSLKESMQKAWPFDRKSETRGQKFLVVLFWFWSLCGTIFFFVHVLSQFCDRSGGRRNFVTCIIVRCLRCFCETSFTLLAYRAGQLRTVHISHTTSLNLSHSWTCILTQSLSSWTSILRISPLPITLLRSTTAHWLCHGSGAGKELDTRVGWPGQYPGAHRGRCVDLHSRWAEGTQSYCWSEAFATVFQRVLHRDRLAWNFWSQVCYNWRTVPINCWSSFGFVSEKICNKTCPNTTNVFFTALHVCINSLCNTTEESNLHERALQAVRSVSAPGEGETETKEIIADVLRGFLLLENAVLTGSEQVFVFGVAGKSHTYSHIANALRETWGNDERLRSHDIALSQQLQGGHLADGVHGKGTGNRLRLRGFTWPVDIWKAIFPSCNKSSVLSCNAIENIWSMLVSTCNWVLHRHTTSSLTSPIRVPPHPDPNPNPSPPPPSPPTAPPPLTKKPPTTTRPTQPTTTTNILTNLFVGAWATSHLCVLFEHRRRSKPNGNARGLRDQNYTYGGVENEVGRREEARATCRPKRGVSNSCNAEFKKTSLLLQNKKSFFDWPLFPSSFFCLSCFFEFSFNFLLVFWCVRNVIHFLGCYCMFFYFLQFQLFLQQFFPFSSILQLGAGELCTIHKKEKTAPPKGAVFLLRAGVALSSFWVVCCVPLSSSGLVLRSPLPLEGCCPREFSTLLTFHSESDKCDLENAHFYCCCILKMLLHLQMMHLEIAHVPLLLHLATVHFSSGDVKQRTTMREKTRRR